MPKVAVAIFVVLDALGFFAVVAGTYVSEQPWKYVLMIGGVALMFVGVMFYILSTRKQQMNAQRPESQESQR